MKSAKWLPFPKNFKGLIGPIVGLGVVGLVLLVLLILYYAAQVPDPSVIAARRVSESTQIYDATGEAVLYDVHGEEKRTVIPWEKIPESIKKAVIASEDNDFYLHKGLDFRGILRAIYKDLITFSASQGGSTITQQLVKKAILYDDKTIARKIKEAVLSVQIERKFSKDDILWMYLNQIPFGSNLYGIEATSQAFFGKSAQSLTNAEAATMASVIKAPSYYSPYGNNVDDLMARKEYVLGRMKDLGFITEEERITASQEKLVFKPRQERFGAPHFVIMVRDYLIEKYGEDTVENGGLKVVTTLDTNLQKIAEEVVTKYGDINEKRYKARNAAFVATDPKTGKILAMVGSRDYFNVANEGNFNVALAPRQPGSSFKPFAYAKAFEKGYTDSTILFDLKTEFNPSCDSSGNQVKDRFGQDCYNPQNYNGSYAGPVTMRESLSRSLNTTSVQTLYLAGIDDTIDLAKKTGITTLSNRERFGLSLVLGGGEVRLLDMATAYGVFANDGIKVAPYFIQKITTADGTVLEEHEVQDGSRVMDAQVARLTTDILSDNNARGPVFGYNSSLYLPDRPIAAKTGTTQKNRDGWLIGYTPSLVAGVWTGNNNNDSMTAEGAGLSAAGPMWNEFMRRAHAGKPVEYFPRPDPVQTNKLMLNGSYQGSDGIHTILYYVDKDNPQGSSPRNPYSDPQFKNWEEAVQRWVTQAGLSQTPTPSPEPSSSPAPSPLF